MCSRFQCTGLDIRQLQNRLDVSTPLWWSGMSNEPPSVSINQLYWEYKSLTWLFLDQVWRTPPPLYIFRPPLSYFFPRDQEQSKATPSLVSLCASGQGNLGSPDNNKETRSFTKPRVYLHIFHMIYIVFIYLLIWGEINLISNHTIVTANIPT